MNKAYCYRTLPILALSMLFALQIHAQDKVERTINQSFSLPQDGKFTIDNKYGNLEIEGWDIDSVKIEIVLSVKHRYLSKAEDLIDRIEPTFVSRPDHIHVTSVIRERRNSLFNDFLKDVFPIDINKTDVDIDYKIKLPSKARLEVTNLFGDVVIDNCFGKLNADVGHGSLWLNSLVESAEINLKFGRLDAREMPDSKLNLKNSKAYIGTTSRLHFESSSSEIEIGTADLLSVTGSRDEYNIEYVHSIEGDIRYTTVRIEELGKNINLTTYLGGVRCDVLPAQDVNILLSQRSSDLDLNISKAAFNLDVTLEGGSLRLPDSAKDIEREMIDEVKNNRHVRARFGSDGQGTIVIIGAKGSIILRDF